MQEMIELSKTVQSDGEHLLVVCVLCCHAMFCKRILAIC